MFKKFRNTIASLLAAASLVAVPMALPAVASAQFDTGNCLAQGTNGDFNSIGNNNCTGNTATSGSSDKISGLVKTIINIFSIVVGVVSVIMIIIAGLRYVTSGGDSNNVSGAKNTIIYAIVGLVIVALAQFIVQFVLNKLNG